ncbi:MAG: D-sedoheptulose 7-phosphate isomerase [Candidatus Omnitrophica bacterium]|nr:D-sedoheptulose 7-phosphate isomerase [Candidatus Omnitrophota bacterium]
MKEIIRQIVSDSIAVKQKAVEDNIDTLVRAVDAIGKTLKKDGKIILFGNGGSAADSQHVAAEFIGRFQKERKSIPAIALTTDTSILTALANDYSFDVVFSRQLEGLGTSKDIAIGLSTSGNSKNVFEAIKTAKKIGMKTISLTGGTGGLIARASDISIIVSSKNTARVQESHICLAHVICELVERKFSKK